MKWSLSRLRPSHIALLSTAYWLGLAALKLGRPVMIAWRLTHLPPNHASISAGFQNLLFRLTMTQDGAVVWAGSTSLAALIGWVVGPPLLLAVTWRLAHETAPLDEADIADAAGRSRTPPPPALPVPPPQWDVAPGQPPERTRKHEGPGAG